MIRGGSKAWLVQYDRLLCWLIRTLTRSRRAHVCIGIRGAVVDPQIRGNFWWAELAFVEEYPALLEYVEIDTPVAPDEAIVQPRGRRPAWPTFIRWVTRGRTPADDCLTVAIDLIHSAGIHINPRTHTPRRLYDQLIQLPGARIVPIADPKPVHEPGRQEPGAGAATA